MWVILQVSTNVINFWCFDDMLYAFCECTFLFLASKTELAYLYWSVIMYCIT